MIDFSMESDGAMPDVVICNPANSTTVCDRRNAVIMNQFLDYIVKFL